MGLRRDTVYLCNIVKCKPAEDGSVLKEHFELCGNFFFKQLEIIKPKVVVVLGQKAASYILKTDKSISELRGRFYMAGGFRIMPTFHLDYILKKPSAKKPVWQDMQMVMKELGLK
jgi:DNA polymerase